MVIEIEILDKPRLVSMGNPEGKSGPEDETETTIGEETTVQPDNPSQEGGQ